MRTGAIPARRASLLGRDDELEQLADLALHSDGRLVTLIGVGGVGKTTLAFEVGRRLERRVPDGVWAVDLAELPDTGDADAVVRASLRALGLVEQARPPLDVLVEYLEPRQALLLIDNCEHVAPAAGAVLDLLLDHCPYLRILATSRVLLRIRAETVFWVAPLPVPLPSAGLAELATVPSVGLFVRRARAADPAFRLDPGNAPAVGAICARLAGLPLAIELAAARVAAMTPSEIAARLGDDTGLLRTEAIRTPNRQQTLEAALAWSYELLASEHRALFRRLSVFAGGWTLEAAEAVCATDGGRREVVGSLAVLVEHSLVVHRAEDGGRYRFLQPIAEFAARRLDAAAERTDVAAPHAQHFLALASRRESGATQPTAELLDVLAVEHDNCLAGIRFAEAAGQAHLVLGYVMALASLWRIRGHLLEGAGHLEIALRYVGDEPTFFREATLLILADFERLLGRHDAASDHAGEALEVAGSIPDPAGQRTALAILGDVATSLGDYGAARARYEQAWPFVIADPHPLATGYWHANRGYIELRDGRLDVAAGHLEAALETLLQTERTWYTGRVYCWLGAVQRRRGQLSEARVHLTKGFAELLRYGARVDAINGVEELARLALDERDPGTGARLLAAAGALRDSMALPADSGDREALDSDIDRARSSLRSTEFAAAWSRGREFTFKEVAALAADPRAATASGRTRDGRRAPRGSLLTRREREVAELVGEGLTNPQIAVRLFVSPGTVRGHVEQILGKLGLTSRVHVALWVVSETEKPVT